MAPFRPPRTTGLRPDAREAVLKFDGPSLAKEVLVDRYERAGRLPFLLEVASAYGSVVQLAPDMLLVTGARQVHEVLTQTNVAYLSNQNFLRQKVDSGRGTARLDRWMQARAASGTALIRSNVATFYPVIIDEAERLARDLTGTWSSRQLVKRLEAYTSTLVGMLAFGSKEPTVMQQASVMLDALLPVVSSPTAFVRHPFLRRLLPASRRVHRELSKLERVVGEALNSHRHGHSVSMAEATDGLDRQSQVQVLISHLLAGHGVPAAAIAWTLLALGSDQRWQQRIRDEIVSSGDDPDGSPALAMAVKESLRLWPPSWMLGREAAEGATLEGIPVPGGTSIMVSSYVAHRVTGNPRDAGRFRPGRWAAQRPDGRASCYIPFGAGPRACPGGTYATVLMRLTLGVLVSRLSFALDRPLEQLGINADRTLLPVGGRITVSPLEADAWRSTARLPERGLRARDGDLQGTVPAEG